MNHNLMIIQTKMKIKNKLNWNSKFNQQYKKQMGHLMQLKIL